MTFSKMCASYDSYFNYLFGDKESISGFKSISSKSDIVDLIIKNDLMYHNDYISKPIYKRAEKHLIKCLIIVS
jgi:hypothetical protein